MIFHLLRTWLAAIFGDAFQSSQKTYQSPLQTIGGSRRRGLSSNHTDRTIGLTFTESEERIMADVKMGSLKPIGGIVVENQIEIRSETRGRDGTVDRGSL
jgi:hypothetical protein